MPFLATSGIVNFGNSGGCQNGQLSSKMSLLAFSGYGKFQNWQLPILAISIFHISWLHSRKCQIWMFTVARFGCFCAHTNIGNSWLKVPKFGILYILHYYYNCKQRQLLVGFSNQIWFIFTCKDFSDFHNYKIFQVRQLQELNCQFWQLQELPVSYSRIQMAYQLNHIMHLTLSRIVPTKNWRQLQLQELPSLVITRIANFGDYTKIANFGNQILVITEQKVAVQKPENSEIV